MALASIYKVGLNDQASQKLEKIGGRVKTLSKVSTDAGEKMKMAFANAIMYRALGELTEQIYGSVEAIRDFSQELATVQGLVGSEGDQLIKLSSEIRKVSTATEHMSSATAEAAVMYARMGRSQEEILSLLPDTLDLITASGKDAELVVQSVGVTMKAFGKDIDEANYVMNTMLATSEKSAQDFGDLAEAMKEVAPISSALGISFKETSAVLGMLADQGLRGTRGGTALKNILTNLLKPSKKTAEALKDVNFEGKSLVDVLQILRTKTDVVDMLDTFQKRAIAAALGLGDSGKAFDEWMQKLDDNRNIITELSDIQRDSLNVQLEKSSSLIKSLGVNFYEAYTQMGESTALEEFNNYLENMNNLLIENPERFEDLFSVIDNLADFLGEVAENMDTILSLMASIGAVKGYMILRNQIVLANNALNSFRISALAASTAGETLSFTMKTMTSATVIGALIVGLTTVISHFNKLNTEIEASQQALADFSERGKERQRDFLKPVLDAFDEQFGKRDELAKRGESLKEAMKELRVEIDRIKAGGETLEYKSDSSVTEIIKTLEADFEILKSTRDRLFSEFKESGQRFDGESLIQTIIDSAEKEGFKFATIKPLLSIEDNGSLLQSFADLNEIGIGNIINFDETYAKLKSWWDSVQAGPPPITPDEKTTVQVGKPREDGGGGGVKTLSGAVSYLNEEILLTESILGRLDQAGFDELFLGYEKSALKTAKSMDDLFVKLDLWYKSSKESGEEDRLKYLTKVGEALGGVSSKIGEAEGSTGVLNYLDELGMSLDTLGEKLGFTSEQWERTQSIIKRTSAEKGSSAGLTKDFSDFDKGMETFLPQVGEFQIPIYFQPFNTKETISQLREQFESVKHLLSDEDLVSFEQQLMENEELEYMTRMQGLKDTADLVTQATLSSFETVFQIQFDRMEERHERQKEILQQEHDLAMTLAGDNAIRRAILEQDYMKKKARMEKEQEKERVERAKKMKAVSMIEATISGAKAVVGTVADTSGGFFTRALAGAAMGALVAGQIATIASQKFALGSRGYVSANGNSDSIPVMLSHKEVVTDADTVQRLGGFEGLQQTISDRIHSQSTGGTTQIFHIGNLYGEESYVRQMWKQIKAEEEQWQY